MGMKKSTYAGSIGAEMDTLDAYSHYVELPKRICLLGALAGDMIGSVFEYSNQKDTNFPLFSPGSQLTDDSILTLAVAQAILDGGTYELCLLNFARRYPDRGYGGGFSQWMSSTNPQAYNSYGNGSAMRVSAVGWAFNSEEEVLEQAQASAEVTHNHPEGIKGAQAVALAILRARQGGTKYDIRAEAEKLFGYDLQRTVEQIRPGYSFNETCQETVPQALIAFLDSHDFEHAIRLAVSLGGDADTLGAISGSIAEAFYGRVPGEIAEEVWKRIPEELRNIIVQFSANIPLT